MAKSKFEMNRAGVRELMLSQEMRAGLESLGAAALSRLGEGYEMETYHGQNRWNVEVKAETYEAKLENAKNNTILKAVQG